MQCRNCGIEIADKALICYKCGTATIEAKYQPVATPRAASSRLGFVVFVVLLVLLVALVLYAGRTSDDETVRSLRWATAAVAVAIVALRVWSRRR